MKISKKKELQKKGWKLGSTKDFLQLTEVESLMIHIKLSLAQLLKEKRKQKKYSQENFAKHIKSSQSRVAKMEKGDPSVSVDLLLSSLISLGTTRKELAKAISSHHFS